MTLLVVFVATKKIFIAKHCKILLDSAQVNTLHNTVHNFSTIFTGNVITREVVFRIETIILGYFEDKGN